MFGDPYLVWHDGPDLRSLVPAVRSDPDTVLRMLAVGLTEQDPVAAQAFEFLAGRSPVLPATELLRAASVTATGGFRVYVARAMFALTADPSWAEPIAEVLAGDESPFVRLDAARSMAVFPPTPTLIAIVARAVCDPEFPVRTHAATTLLRYAGSRRSASDSRRRWAKITSPAQGPASDADRRSWREVADELSARALAASR
jgi:hypothetical protein